MNLVLSSAERFMGRESTVRSHVRHHSSAEITAKPLVCLLFFLAPRLER